MKNKTEKILRDAEEQGIPIFVITAKDKASIETLENYYNTCLELDCDINHLDDIYCII